MRLTAAARVRSSAFGQRWLYTFNMIDAEEWPKACCAHDDERTEVIWLEQ